MNNVLCASNRRASLVIYLFGLLLIGSTSLYAQEICNNGIDDDGDGYIDCFDSDCSGNSACADFYYGSPSPDCQFIPPNSTLALTTQWTGGPVSGHSVMVTGDLDGDGFPEIVARNQNLISGSNQQGLGGANGIRIFDGRNGNLKYTPTTLHIPFTNNGFVIADADRNGYGEFYYITAWNTPGGDDRKLVCYAYNPTTKVFDLKWKSNVKIGNSNDGVFYSPEIADFNQDGTPELYVGNQVFNSQNGNQICNGGLSNSKGWSYCEPFHPAAFSVAFDALSPNTVLPSTGNPCGAPCNGLELIAGNVVYTVDVSSGVMNIAMQAPSSVPDGNTTLLDYDLDGDIDAAITSIQNGQGKLFIWDLQTSSLLANPLTLQTVDNMGRANVGDFDNDGKPELGICTERYYRVVDDYTQKSGNNLTYLWTLSTSDNSGMTNATVFDFDGNGSFEIVYRDEQNLRILKGLDGSQLTSIPCSSPTAGEYPLVADIDADGETEIVCACGGVVNGQVRAFRSNNKPWIAARKVWNQHSYFNVNINDDLTVPRVQQAPHLEFPQTGSGRRPLNIFLAQSTVLDSSGRIAFPAADAVPKIINTSCVNDSIEVTFKVYNRGSYALSNQLPIAVYHKNPLLETSAPFKIVYSNNVIVPGDSFTLSVFVAKTEALVYLVANDNGSLSRPYNLSTQFPITSIGECNYANNLDSSLLAGSNINTTYIRPLCFGDTFQILNLPSPGVNYLWTGNMYISDVNSLNAKVFTLTTDTAYLHRQDPNCPSFTTWILSIQPKPSISLSLSDTLVCSGSSVDLQKYSSSGDSSYWDFAPFQGDTVSILNYFPSQNQYISAIAHNGICITRDSVQLSMAPSPVFDPIPDTSLCQGMMLDLAYTQNTANQTYEWSPSLGLSHPDSSFTRMLVQPGSVNYSVRIRLGNCEAFDDFTVFGSQAPIGPTLIDTSYCEGDTLELFFASNLLWKYNWLPSNAVLVDTLSSIQVLPGFQGYLKLRISDGGCFSEDSFLLTQKPKPSLKVYSNAESLCSGDTFKVSLQGAEYYSLPGFSILNSTDTTFRLLASEGSLVVIQGESQGCSSWDTLLVQYADEPELSLMPSYWLCPGENLALIKAQRNVSYQYLNPQGQLVNRVDSAGKYTLIASNACTQKSLEFEVFTTTQENCELYFPNAFSPDLNQLNDAYPFDFLDTTLYGPCMLQEYSLRIYSRWGELIFETTEPTEHWDGTFKGIPVESGVFLYYAQYKYYDSCKKGEVILNKKGNITLLR
ncbi:MAG: hypothetical protein EP332_02305 [Bacteroidetes bacterium]|nr:MAG: hypothetical protein EP332_02305 [Bacteroidota bacterium]